MARIGPDIQEIADRDLIKDNILETVEKIRDRVRTQEEFSGSIFTVSFNQETTAGSGGTDDHGSLTGLGDDDHIQYVSISAARVITAIHNFSPSAPQAPFTLAANAQGQTITGLRADQLDKQVIAGDGVTGGGALTADRTITLGTPGTLSVSTADGVTTSSHTHAITSSNDPGAAAAILATGASGDLRIPVLDVGLNAGANQFRAGWSVTDHVYIASTATLGTISGISIDLEITADGTLDISSSGNMTLDPGGTLVATPAGTITLTSVGDFTLATTAGSNGDIILSPGGSGVVSIGGATLSLTPTGDLTLNPGGILHLDGSSVDMDPSGAITANPGGTITLTSTGLFTLATASNGNIELSPGGTGDVVLNGVDVDISPTGTVTIAPGTTTTITGTAVTLNPSGTVNIDGASVSIDPTGGVNVTAGNTVNIQATGDLSLTTLSSGDIYLTPNGTGFVDIGGTDLVFTGSGDVYPLSSYAADLGLITRKWLSLHAAELAVETLVARDTQATIGGRILVGPTTILEADLTAVATTMSVRHNNLANGDRVRLEAGGNVEWIAIASAPSGTGPYTYTITRNLDGTGADAWEAGSAVFNTGTTGDGFIDLYSTAAAHGTGQGPTIVGNIRTGTTYSDLVPGWAIGHLEGVYGQASGTYGVGLGRYAAGYNHIKITDAGGLEFIEDTATVRGQLTGDTWTLGVTTAEHVQITPTALNFNDGGSTLGSLTGALWTIGNTATEHLTISGTKIEMLDGATVKFRLEGGTIFAGDPTAQHVRIGGSYLRLYNSSNAIWAELDTSSLTLGTAGKDRIILDNTQLKIVDDTGVERLNSNASWIRIGDSNYENILLSPTAMIFYEGATNWAQLSGSQWILGQVTQEHIEITATALGFYDGVTNLGEISGSEWRIGDINEEYIKVTAAGGIIMYGSDGVVTAQLDNDVWVLGRPSGYHTRVSPSDIQFKNISDVLTQISGGTITLGLATDENIKIDAANGIRIYGADGSTLRTQIEGETITLGTGTTSTGSEQLTDGGLETIQIKASASDLVTNGGFETLGGGGADVFGTWVENTNSEGTITAETTLVHAGTYSAKVERTATTVPNPVNVTQTLSALTQGTYALTFYTRGDGTNAGSYQVYNATLGDLIAKTSTGISGTTYTQVTAYFSIPAGATTYNVDIILHAPDAIGSAYFDAVVVKPAEWTNWTEADNGLGTVIPIASTKHGGSYAALIERDTAGASEVELSQGIGPLAANTNYRLEFWTRGDGNVAAEVRVNCSTDGEVIPETSTGIYGTTWTKVTFNFVSSAIQFATVFFRANEVLGTVYVDDVSIQPVTKATRLLLDPVNGIRFLDTAGSQVGQWVDDQITLGYPTDRRIELNSTGIRFYAGGGLERGHISGDGSLLWYGDGPATERLQYDSTNGLQLFDGANNPVLKVPPSGDSEIISLVAAGGDVILNSNGITIGVGTTYSEGRAVTWKQSTTKITEISSLYNSGVSHSMYIGTANVASSYGTVSIDADGGNGGYLNLSVKQSGTAGPVLKLEYSPLSFGEDQFRFTGSAVMIEDEPLLVAGHSLPASPSQSNLGEGDVWIGNGLAVGDFGTNGVPALNPGEIVTLDPAVAYAQLTSLMFQMPGHRAWWPNFNLNQINNGYFGMSFYGSTWPRPIYDATRQITYTLYTQSQANYQSEATTSGVLWTVDSGVDSWGATDKGLTVGAWIYVTAHTATDQGILTTWDAYGDGAGNGYASWRMLIDAADNDNFRVSVSSDGEFETGQEVALTGAIPTGKWVFVAFRWDPSTEIKAWMYYDGALQETGTNTTSIVANLYRTSSVRGFIGAYRRSTGAYNTMNGRIWSPFFGVQYVPDSWITKCFEYGAAVLDVY